MIYWLTGQPAHGKTVLGNLLKTYLENLKNSNKKLKQNTYFIINFFCN